MVVDRGEDRLRGWSWCAAEIETADDDGRSGSLSGGTTGVSTVAVGVACVDAIRTMITKPKSITKPEWCAIAITHAAQAGINRATRRRCRAMWVCRVAAEPAHALPGGARRLRNAWAALAAAVQGMPVSSSAADGVATHEMV